MTNSLVAIVCICLLVIVSCRTSTTPKNVHVHAYGIVHSAHGMKSVSEIVVELDFVSFHTFDQDTVQRLLREIAACEKIGPVNKSPYVALVVIARGDSELVRFAIARDDHQYTSGLEVHCPTVTVLRALDLFPIDDRAEILERLLYQPGLYRNRP